MLVMTDIYAASEEPIAGISSEILLEEIRQHGQRHTHYIPELGDIPAQIRPLLNSGDLVLTLGAGDIVKSGEELLLFLEQTF